MSAKALGECVYAVDISTGRTNPIYKLTSARDAGLKESWYRDAIFEDPELVVGVCRRAGMVPDGEGWFPWAKEFGVDTGSIDVMLLSTRGRIGIVETKLSFNPERRREVVAQVLDYALALQDLSVDDLPVAPSGTAFVPPDRHEIVDRLAAGNFLLIIAGDQLEPRAIRLSEALIAGHLTSEWDLAMVDLNLYAGESPATHVLVPELRGKLIHETRQVVRVMVEGSQPKAKIQVERLPDPGRAGRTTWNAKTFFDALAAADVSAEFRALAQGFADVAARHARASVAFGTGAMGSITLRHDGASILSLWLDGRAEAKPRAYVERALGPGPAAEYLKAVQQLWGSEFVDGWKRPTADQVKKQAVGILTAVESAIRLTEAWPPQDL